jgi:hypothetical protein
MLLQPWIQKHERADGAELLRRLSSQLLLHGQRVRGGVRGQRALPEPVAGLHQVLLRPGLEGREQHAVRGVPEPHVLLRRLASDLPGGDVLAPAGMGPAELLVHSRKMGPSRWPVHPVWGWQVQPVARMQGVLQHFRRGLRAVRGGDLLYRFGQEHNVRRLCCWHVLLSGEHSGRHCLPVLHQRDVFACRGCELHVVSSWDVWGGLRERVHGLHRWKVLAGRGHDVHRLFHLLDWPVQRVQLQCISECCVWEL